MWVVVQLTALNEGLGSSGGQAPHTTVDVGEPGARSWVHSFDGLHSSSTPDISPCGIVHMNCLAMPIRLESPPDDPPPPIMPLTCRRQRVSVRLPASPSNQKRTWFLSKSFIIVWPALVTASCLSPLAAPPDWSKSFAASLTVDAKSSQCADVQWLGPIRGPAMTYSPRR